MIPRTILKMWGKYVILRSGGGCADDVCQSPAHGEASPASLTIGPGHRSLDPYPIPPPSPGHQRSRGHCWGKSGPGQSWCLPTPIPRTTLEGICMVSNCKQAQGLTIHLSPRQKKTKFMLRERDHRPCGGRILLILNVKHPCRKQRAKNTTFIWPPTLWL